MSATATQLFISPVIHPSTEAIRLSASCQQLITSDFTSKTGRVVVRSCLADTALFPIVAGHECNNTALTPAGLLADMALIVGKYTWQQLNPRNPEIPGLSVCDMEISKNMIVEIPQTAPGQHIEIEASIDLTVDGKIIHCKWRSVKQDGIKLQDHAVCIVRIEAKAVWQEEWSRRAHFVSCAITDLDKRALVGGSAHKFQRGLAYKLFRTFVQYSPKYQAMSEVVMEGLEASATIDFQTTADDYGPPFHIDGIGVISGLVSNGSDVLEDDQVYIAHGWEALKVLDPEILLSSSAQQKRAKAGAKLRNYVYMQRRPNGILQGDVYVLESEVDESVETAKGERIVAVWECVRFKSIPKRILDLLLPPKKKKVVRF